MSCGKVLQLRHTIRDVPLRVLHPFVALGQRLRGASLRLLRAGPLALGQQQPFVDRWASQAE